MACVSLRVKMYVNVPLTQSPLLFRISIIGNKTIDWITALNSKPVEEQRPYFAYFAPHAPHSPATPAKWYGDDEQSWWMRGERREETTRVCYVLQCGTSMGLLCGSTGSNAP